MMHPKYLPVRALWSAQFGERCLQVSYRTQPQGCLLLFQSFLHANLPPQRPPPELWRQSGRNALPQSAQNRFEFFLLPQSAARNRSYSRRCRVEFQPLRLLNSTAARRLRHVAAANSLASVSSENIHRNICGRILRSCQNLASPPNRAGNRSQPRAWQSRVVPSSQ